MSPVLIAVFVYVLIGAVVTGVGLFGILYGHTGASRARRWHRMPLSEFVGSVLWGILRWPWIVFAVARRLRDGR